MAINPRPPRLLSCFFVVFAIMFVGGFLAMIAGGIWKYSLYRDCVNDGHKAYQCQAMLNDRAGYVAVDDISSK